MGPWTISGMVQSILIMSQPIPVLLVTVMFYTIPFMDYVTNNRLWLYGSTSPSQASDRFNTIIQSLLCLTEYGWNLKKIQTVVWDAKGLAGEVIVYKHIIPMNVWWLINYTAAGFKSIMSRTWDCPNTEYDNEIKIDVGGIFCTKKAMKNSINIEAWTKWLMLCGRNFQLQFLERKFIFKFHWHWFKWPFGTRVGKEPLPE